MLAVRARAALASFRTLPLSLILTLPLSSVRALPPALVRSLPRVSAIVVGGILYGAFDN